MHIKQQSISGQRDVRQSIRLVKDYRGIAGQGQVRQSTHLVRGPMIAYDLIGRFSVSSIVMIQTLGPIDIGMSRAALFSLPGLARIGMQRGALLRLASASNLAA